MRGFELQGEPLDSEALYRRLLAYLDRTGGTGAGAQVDVIRRSGLFDPELYCETYRDVAWSSEDPLLHYVESGDDEGRWPNAYFDPLYYRRQFRAKGRWPFTALYHYITQGEKAGLRPCAAFDRDQYLQSAPGLGPWVKRPLAHYLWIGRPNGLAPRRYGRAAAETAVPAPRPSPQVDARLSRAVNVIGPLDRMGGTGVSARGYLSGVAESGFGPVGTSPRRREFNAQSSIDGDMSFPGLRPDAAVNVVHMGGDTLPRLLQSVDADVLLGRYNIAVWYWELPTLRPDWWELMDRFHEFWAPTPFVARALRQLTAKPVKLTPPYLPHLATPATRPEPGSDPHFVYCFDANSVVERKNPGLLLEAFRRAFPADGEARLTFKITHANPKDPRLTPLYAAASQSRQVRVLDRSMSDGELRDLMANATAYVSPHRSEGLGLTVVEAMALGVPVIATPFGGLEQVVTSDASWPLDFHLVELGEDIDVYPAGYVWAEPHLGSLAEALRAVVEDPASASVRAAIARKRVLNIFASTNLVEAYRDALISGMAQACDSGGSATANVAAEQ